MSAAAFDHDAVLDEMRAILIGCAKRRETITYAVLAGLISGVSLHHRAPIFHRLLTRLNEPDSAEPALATLVVRKDSGLPGSGYFAGSEGDVGTLDAQRAYWQIRFDAVCDYWADHRTALSE